LYDFSGRDNDFYSSLAAAAAENEMSDVSDADPAEMAKTLSVSVHQKYFTI
jgi:hypothetical protein